MKKILSVIIIFAAVVTLAGGYFFISDPTFKVKVLNNVSKLDGKTEPAPRELTDLFDATKSVSRFMVLGVSENDSNSLRLRGVWPKAVGGAEIVAKVDCGGGVIYRQGQEKKGDILSENEIIEIVKNNPQGDFLFGGVCGDSQCSRFVGDCELYLGGGS